MSRVYLSFLGLGVIDERKGTGSYKRTVYELDGQKSSETEFIQVAEHEILRKKSGRIPFDKTIIVVTQKSYDTHFWDLEARLRSVGAANIVPVFISEDMSAEGQWIWFEKILAQLDHGDRLTADLTHGYRASPIVFSTAINFLRKAKNIGLEAVYYGAFDKDRKLTPIIDMKEFYLINEWAEAVSRVAEDADARKLARVGKDSPHFQVGGVDHVEFVRGLDDLTNLIRNVDMHHVAEKAGEIVSMIDNTAKSATAVEKLLLDLVKDKFVSLVPAEPLTGFYDWFYFEIQTALIRMLLEHKLYMQAFTVMRELIGSIGLIRNPKAKTTTSAGRDERAKAEVFINMLQFQEEKWDFHEKQSRIKEGLMPWYHDLKDWGVEGILRGFLPDMIKYRNGFDHGWTDKAASPGDVAEKGQMFCSALQEALALLRNKQAL